MWLFLSETEVTAPCRKHFSADCKGKVSFQISIGELIYLCQEELWLQIWFSMDISICWFLFWVPPVVSQCMVVLGTVYLLEEEIAAHIESTLHCCHHSITSSIHKYTSLSSFHQEKSLYFPV